MFANDRRIRRSWLCNITSPNGFRNVYTHPSGKIEAFGVLIYCLRELTCLKLASECDSFSSTSTRQRSIRHTTYAMQVCAQRRRQRCSRSALVRCLSLVGRHVRSCCYDATAHGWHLHPWYSVSFDIRRGR